MFFHQLWSKELKDPSGTRSTKKPRKTGLTMVIDQGIGLDSFSDLLQLHAGYIDYVKLGAGTATLYPPSILKKKADAARLCQVEFILDRSVMEVALTTKQVKRFYDSLSQLEIHTIELPENSPYFDRKTRTKLIQEGKKEGFNVHTTYHVQQGLSTNLLEDIHKNFIEDMEAGASYFAFTDYPGIWVIEGLKEKLPYDRLIVPAEQQAYQKALIQSLGNQVNISDLPIQEALSLESLRRGIQQIREDRKVSNEG